jgi:hypothetical protein
MKEQRGAAPTGSSCHGHHARGSRQRLREHASDDTRDNLKYYKRHVLANHIYSTESIYPNTVSGYIYTSVYIYYCRRFVGLRGRVVRSTSSSCEVKGSIPQSRPFQAYRVMSHCR